VRECMCSALRAHLALSVCTPGRSDTVPMHRCLRVGRAGPTPPGAAAGARGPEARARGCVHDEGRGPQRERALLHVPAAEPRLSRPHPWLHLPSLCMQLDLAQQVLQQEASLSRCQLSVCPHMLATHKTSTLRRGRCQVVKAVVRDSLIESLCPASPNSLSCHRLARSLHGSISLLCAQSCGALARFLNRRWTIRPKPT